MGIIKTAIIGAAVYAGVKYITKKDPITGQSILDDFFDKTSDFADEVSDKAKSVKRDVKSTVRKAKNNLAV